METKRLCKEKRSCTGEVQERWKSEEYRYIKKEYADLDKASQTIDDYLESLRDEPERKRKKSELE